MGQGIARNITIVEGFMTLLPWVRPHLTRQSKQGRALQADEREALTGVRVAKEGPQTRLEGDLKHRIGGVTTWLSVGSAISVLQEIEREHKTLKDSILEMHKKEVACRIGMSQGPQSRIGGCNVAWVGWEVTIGVTVHDKRSNLRKKERAIGN